MAPVGLVCDLRDPSATPEVVGAKAANLAVAARAGLPTLPGLVLTTAAVARGLVDPDVRAAAEEIFERLGGGPDQPLAVRSSSTIEDAGSSSMAGRFTSVLDVRDRDSFREAVAAVVGSADRVRDEAGRARPLAVLVQRQADAALGGVMFGVDPVTGAQQHIVVDVVAGSPDGLVSGRLVADHYVLTRRGRLVEGPSGRCAPPLAHGLRRRLTALACRAERAFGGPQDIEWLVDPAGSLVLLQARPVTAVAAPEHLTRGRRADQGVLLGPGPVAETFPEALSTLAADLWIEPLAEGIRAAVGSTGAVSPRDLARSPVVTTVNGWAAADLELFGIALGHRSLRRRLSPAVIGRRLGAAWSVGRLRAQFPEIAATLLATVDRHLAELGPLAARSVSALGELLVAARRELVTVHTHEVLAGMLVSTSRPTATDHAWSAAGAAVDALRSGRARGLSDQQIIETMPEVLLLVPPRVGGIDALPHGGGRVEAESSGERSGAARASLDELGPREALRLRARWLQELVGRLAGEVGARLEAGGRITDRRAIEQLSLDELLSVVGGAPVPAGLETRAATAAGPALPTSFRWSPETLADLGRMSQHPAGSDRVPLDVVSGTPAGGGRAVGVVVHDPADVANAQAPVLVVRHLDPRLAPVLSSLVGLIAETGSPLSHLAILAREAGLPTVVAVADAQRRCPTGVSVGIDGRRGEIRLLTPVGGRR